jgi:hypothetical protein
MYAYHFPDGLIGIVFMVAVHSGLVITPFISLVRQRISSSGGYRDNFNKPFSLFIIWEGS